MASTSEASTSERLHWPTLVVGGVFFLVGAILGGVALWQLYADSRAIDGERTRAEVLRKAIHADRTQGSRYLAGDPRVNRAAHEGGYAMPVVLLLIGPLFALIRAFLAWGSWLARKEP